MNLWSCDTGVQKIAAHTPGTDALHYEATWVKQCDKYRGGLGRYYLETKRSLLDAESEFLLDQETNELFWIPPTPVTAPLVAHGRRVDWSLNVTNSSYAIIANLSFLDP